MPVGYFEEPEYPGTAGRYRYMPYRGVGHYHMGQALKTGPARCSFSHEGSRYEFVVTAVPEYGVLEIVQVETVAAR
jgi:hypothetical protein